jgi:hypothetical protein
MDHVDRNKDERTSDRILRMRGDKSNCCIMDHVDRNKDERMTDKTLRVE